MVVRWQRCAQVEDTFSIQDTFMKRKSLQPNASESAQAILAMIQQIPYGKVATYGQVAALSGYPRNARQVGAILRKLPPNSGVPWYRVINSKGEISLRESMEHVFRQRDYLEAEGIELEEKPTQSDNETMLKIPLSKYRWVPEQD